MDSYPVATYRLQLRAEFGFDQAAEIADYLADLGVSHVYLSPYLQAAPGSAHGYDVVDPQRVSKDLGGGEGLKHLDRICKQHGLGQVCDVVPNHMGTDLPQNAWWWDVLANGRASRYAGHFDIDWNPPGPRLRGKVLLPVLTKDFDEALRDGDIRIGVLPEKNSPDGEQQCVVLYGNSVFPLSPESRGEAERLGMGAGAEIAREALDSLLAKQNYLLEDWRHGNARLNYRRFFAINKMAALHAEKDEVFRDTHGLTLGLLKDGMIEHLRVDHPDGLYKPEEYFARLRGEAPEAWIVVEKVLAHGERLPESWPVDGTTGYDFLARLSGLFVDSEGEQPLTDFYGELTDERRDYGSILREKKRMVVAEMFECDVSRLVKLTVSICEDEPNGCRLTRETIREALLELAAGFSIYRTYAHASVAQIVESDVAAVSAAVDSARDARPDIDPDIWGFLSDLLCLHSGGPLGAEFAMRFQQLTPAVMAKGGEDTAFYCYNRLVSLNEVGGDPEIFGTSVEEFHAANERANEKWPRTMLATSTHDTKRSEDVRARISLLSEIPNRWIAAVRRWSAMNARHRSGEAPDRNTEYLLYQTLVGAWPLEQDRALAYMVKAAREASVHTSWTSPNVEFEKGLDGFIRGMYGDGAFQEDLRDFVAPLAEPGRIASLSQVLLKLTSPGIPDIYQGTEIWDLSLVDPDNRRPVDYELRRRLLRDATDATPEEAWRRCDEGLPKLWLIKRVLEFRRRFGELFGAGATYSALPARGAKSRNVVAFARGYGGMVAVTVVPRLVMGFGGDWGETVIELPGGRWRNVLTGDWYERGRVEMGVLTERFPVVLLSLAGGRGGASNG